MTQQLNDSYWTYRAPVPTDYADLPEDVFRGTRKDWESLTPGMRRELMRDHQRRTARESTQ